MSELWTGTSGYVDPTGAGGSSTRKDCGSETSSPEPETFDRWRDAVPEGFLFAMEASRYITHVRRLRDTAEPLLDLVNPGREAKRKRPPQGRTPRWAPSQSIPADYLFPPAAP
jgi:hypothetical protein